MVLAVLLCAAPATVASADQPTGTISCSIASGDEHSWPYTGFEFHPGLTGIPKTQTARVTDTQSSCDNSGITGGSAPITEVSFRLTGKLREATCASFFSSASTLDKGKIKIRWVGLNPAGNRMTVATSKATVASASYDDGTDTMTIVTDPIDTGAFVDQVATLHLAFQGDLDLYSSCIDENMTVRYAIYGGELSTLEVQ